MTTLTLELPFPPTVNNLHAVVGRRKVLSKRGREYRAAVLAACWEQHAPKLGTARLRLHVTVHAPDRRRRDLDNLSKGLLDGLTNAGVLDDDSQVDDLRLVRGAIRKPGGVIVQLEVLT